MNAVHSFNFYRPDIQTEAQKPCEHGSCPMDANNNDANITCKLWVQGSDESYLLTVSTGISGESDIQAEWMKVDTDHW